MRLIYILTLIALITACSIYLPESRVDVGDERPRIAVDGAIKGQVLFVDGLKMGQARNYNGDPNVLLLEKGRHKVEVRDADGSIVLSEEVYLGGGETRTFSLGHVE